MANDGTRLVGVYVDDRRARAVARSLQQAGASPDDIRIGDDRDHLASLAGEMRAETQHTIGAPGGVIGTKEMTKGMALGVAAGSLLGLVLALPFAAIPFGDFGVWARLLIVACIGATVGSVFGWVMGGAFAAKRPDEQLAAESGVTLATPATPEAELTLIASDPIRLDLVAGDGQPLRAIASHDDHIARDIGRHLAAESRQDG